MCKILFLSSGPIPLHKSLLKESFFHLSKFYSGDYLSPLFGKTHPIEKTKFGNFSYHPVRTFHLPKPIKHLFEVVIFFLRAKSLHSKYKYNLIICRDVWKMGLVGLVLKKITGIKFIVEVRGNYRKALFLNSREKKKLEMIKLRIAEWIMVFVLNRADHIRLLYPHQLEEYKNIKNDKRSTFHNFVPISNIKPCQKSDKYILFLGYPWYLKGIDILIRAFKSISQEFPEYKLKVVGYCPDRSYFEKLAEGNNKIELCNPVVHSEAIELMCRCNLFVLPSRTEAMGRVLLEAMACKKPIIASNVDGIPHYIKHGFNGLLFESENVDDLADKIRALLGNSDYALELQKNGYKYVHEHLSEECYVESFKKMIDKVLKCSKRR